MRELIKENRGRPNDHLIPEMKKALAAARRFMAAHPAAFQPKKLGDDKTTQRLLAIGMYETDSSRGVVDVDWDSPRGFKCNWAPLSLSLSYPKKKPELLEPLLDAVDSVRKRLPKRLKEWREQLLTSFREVYHPQMADWELGDYETDAKGEVTDKSIISHVESVNVSLSIERKGDEIFGVTSFGVDWDEEHGFEIEW